MKAIRSKRVITYVVLVYLLSLPAYLIHIYHRTFGISPWITIGIVMWMPALAAIITKLIFDKTISGLGWKLGEIKWLVLSYVIPIAYGTIAYGVLWLTGLAGINKAYHFNFVHLVIYWTLINALYATGEEIGWRGFLMPELSKLTSYTNNCLITGVIWALWHFPLLIFASYMSGIPIAARLPFVIISVMAATFIVGWLRLKSGSLWTGVLYHASHNNYIQRFFTPLAIPTVAYSKYLIGESGFAMVLTLVIFAVVFWKLRHKLDNM